MQMVGPWGRYLPQWLRAPCKGSGPARSTQYADGRTLGRYLPQWLRAPGNGSGPAICQHIHTHTLDLTHHNVCFRDPIRYTCQLCIPNTHMHSGPYTYTLYISQKDTQERVKDSTHNVHPYAQVRYTSHLQSRYAVMRQLLFLFFRTFFLHISIIQYQVKSGKLFRIYRKQ